MEKLNGQTTASGKKISLAPIEISEMVMNDLALFAIGSERNRWLAAKGSAVAGNIANADTPGYKAHDVAAFEAALSAAGTQVARTKGGHLANDGPGDRRFEIVPRGDGATKYSGNSVGIEAEMTTLGEVRSQHALVNGVFGAFHRMLLMSSRG